MSFFLKRCLLFLSLLIATNVVLLGVYYYAINRTSFKLDDQKTILIVGDSHTALAIDDERIPSGLNMSSTGEGYLFTYVKLKRFLEANKQISTVLLSFNYNSLAKNKDRWITDENGATGKIQKFSPLFGNDEYQLYSTVKVFYDAVVKIPFSQKKTYKSLLKNRVSPKEMKMGGYEASTECKLDAAMQSVRGGEVRDAAGISNYQVNYLKKIVDLCAKHNTKLVFINTPVYKNALPYYDTTRYYSFYKKNYSNIALFDFAKLDIDSLGFRDAEHLNVRGANKLSDTLNRVLIKRALSPTN